MTVSANDICANKKRMQKVKIASDQNQSTKKYDPLLHLNNNTREKKQNLHLCKTRK